MTRKKNKNITFRVRKVGKRGRSYDSDIRNQLHNIYKDKTGRIPNMGRLERKRSSFFRFLVWVILFIALVFLGVVGVSFYLFGPKTLGQFTSERVFVDMNTPKEVRSGEKFSIEIRLGNDEDVTLTRAQLTLRLPDSFSLTKIWPEPTENYTWELGTLLPGKRATIKLEGFLVNDVGTKERLSADLLYWPENFHSEFHETASTSILLTESTIEATIISQEVVLVDEEFSYSFEIENTTDSQIDDMMVEFGYPAGFLIEQSEPEPDEGDKFWKIDLLEPGQKYKIEVIGRYRPSATSGTKQFRAILSVFSQELDDYVVQKEVSYTQKLAKDDLSINVLGNDSTEDSFIEFGDQVEYTILYANKGDTDIKDLRIRLKLESDIIDWLAFWDDEFSARLEGTTLYWEIEGGLKSGDEGILKVKIPVISNPEEAEGDDFAIHALAEASLDGGNSWKKASNSLSNPISSSIALSGQARYQDGLGNIVGNGTFPPEPDKETTYQIVYTLDNGLQEITSVTLTIPLSNNTTYEGGVNVSTGTLNYDSALHQLVWRIGRLPAGVGGLRASFLVSITPSQEDLAGDIVLAEDAVFSAKDTLRGTQLSQSIPAIVAPLN